MTHQPFKASPLDQKHHDRIGQYHMASENAGLSWANGYVSWQPRLFGLLIVEFGDELFSRNAQGVMEILAGGVARVHGIGHKVDKADEMIFA